MTPDADVAILGGGCAGLSLAVALARHAPRLRVVTVEARTIYHRDRTWAFWNTTDHPFRAGITREWHRWRVRCGGEQVLQESAHFRYQHLPADHFYTLAQELLRKGDQELLLGVSSGAVRQVGESSNSGKPSNSSGICEVETSQGPLRAKWVFDARTPAPGATPLLWQRFLGWHVRTEQPCFDPACVELMDFQPSAEPDRTAFFYILPFSQHEALVEITYLDAGHLPPEDGEQRLRERLQRLCPDGRFTVLYQETGALPMGLPQEPAEGSPAMAIGTRGGRVKPSSGYAFQRIQRQSEALARALARGGPLPTRVEPLIYATLDRIFLQALRRRPERTAAYFLQLFRRVSPKLLVPFLSETAGAQAILTTMLALPKADFARAALFPASPRAAGA